MKTNVDNSEARKAEDIGAFTNMLESNMKALEEDRKEVRLAACYLLLATCRIPTVSLSSKLANQQLAAFRPRTSRKTSCSWSTAMALALPRTARLCGSCRCASEGPLCSAHIRLLCSCSAHTLRLCAGHGMILALHSSCLQSLEETAEELKAGAEKVQNQQKLFNKHDPNSSGEVNRFEELKEVVDDIQLKKKLWDSLREFGELTAQWTQTQVCRQRTMFLKN